MICVYVCVCEGMLLWKIVALESKKENTGLQGKKTKERRGD